MVKNAEQHRRTRNPGFIQPDVQDMTLTGMDNLQLWFRADKINLSDNDPVVTWADDSGNGRDATQGVAGNRPVFKTNIIGGYPVVRFSGAKFLDFTSYIYNLSTYFVVWSRTTNGNDVVLGYSGVFYAYLQYASLWHMYSAANISVAMGTGTFLLKSMMYNNSVYAGYTNGSAHTPLAGAGDAYYRYIGANTGVLSGDIAEVVVFDTNLSTLNRQFVENYLNTKYALW